MRTKDPKLERAILQRAKEGDPYCRIVAAQHFGRGVRLTAHQVHLLTLDDAIEAAAEEHAATLIEDKVL